MQIEKYLNNKSYKRFSAENKDIHHWNNYAPDSHVHMIKRVRNAILVIKNSLSRIILKHRSDYIIKIHGGH